MNRNPLMSVATAALSAFAGMFLLHCNQPPSVVGNGTGGVTPGGGNGGGGAPSDASLENTGGNLPDADPVHINTDVIPAWWGITDAYGPDTPPPPSLDAHCGITQKETVRQLVDILLVLDRSTSMRFKVEEDCYCTNDSGPMGRLCADTTDCVSRWAALAPAVKATLADSENVFWGLKLYPNAGNMSCAVSETMDVEVGADSAPRIEELIDSPQYSSSTPTAAAVASATTYLKGLSDNNKRVILLATDGEPNCKGGTVGAEDVDGASAACAAALEAGFPVYVIGIGPTVSNLSALAEAGGTNDYYPATSPEQLAEALNAISKIVGSCTYQADAEPEDPANVAVYVNKQMIEKDAADGWKYGSTTKDIELTGKYCQDILDGKATAVQILFGCPGAPPFDPFLP